MDKEWLAVVQGIGFPAAVAFFVLWRLERALKELTIVITELKLALYRDPTLRPRWPDGPPARP